MAADRSAVRQRADVAGPGRPSLGAVAGQTREASLEAAPETDPLELDRLIHEPARLAILTNLFVVDSADHVCISHVVDPGNMLVTNAFDSMAAEPAIE